MSNLHWWQWLLLILGTYGALDFWLVYGRAPFHYRYNRLIAWFLKQRGMVAITIGATCYRVDMSTWSDQADRHERAHYHQWRVRPFFGPVYLFWILVRGYDHNADENEARRESGEDER